MSLINELRFDIGDDALISGSGAAVIIPPIILPDFASLITSVRTDISDDTTLSGTFTAPILPTGIPGPGSLIFDVRYNVADDDVIVSGAVLSIPTGALVSLSGSLVIDLRVDIGDEAPGQPVIFPQCPVVWCARIVTQNSYNVQPHDVIILSNPTLTGNVTINMPAAPILGQLYIIKDLAGIAFNYPITVNVAPYTIDGLSSFSLTQNKQSITLMWGGIEWSIV